MRNIALILMYNGTAYHGWQVQKTEVTVAQTLERGLSMVCGEPVKCTGCGRTDAGVHAEHYVANFRTSSRIPVDRIPFAVNTHIPEDIVVKAAYEVAEDFNAIGSCLKKEYTYRIYNSRVKNPFYVNRAYFYPKRLDEEFLNRATHQFVTGAVRCESEEVSVGGLDQVGVSVFAPFDYVALGHIHGPQHVGRETVRYCGTPLKYSFSEASQHKSVTFVELGEKGSVTIAAEPLVPRHDLRELRGSYMEKSEAKRS